MPYEEIYLQRLKEENPEEYTKIEKPKQIPKETYPALYGSIIQD